MNTLARRVSWALSTRNLAFSSTLYTALLLAPPAFAIPSPELVIGSVSSLSQVFAVAMAALTGTGAMLARRLGLRLPAGGRLPLRLLLVLLALVLGLSALNLWQYQSHQSQELARLQATLTRPAQFDGAKIHDQNLKETSFGKQSLSPLAISTDAAQQLLSAPGDDNVFFDVRETGEHRMGTLPGARHVRYPDFLAAGMDLRGKQVVLFCHNGNRSSETCAALAAQGIDCRFIAGGIEKWLVEGRQFSDLKVQSLSDLRALPDYANKDRLLGTADFEKLLARGELQIVDTRYPGDFATGHLPGAINLPLRALPTPELKARIEALDKTPTIAACYDRRSCFMAQVLGLEMSAVGIEFLGRYTTPWEYFVPPTPKPHVQEWLAAQQTGWWQSGVNHLAAALLWLGQRTHFVLGLVGLALLSRLMVLPIALKSERDQMISARHAEELKTLKQQLHTDPTRKARAVHQFYADKGLTPMRNMLALLFLPLMMLGLSAIEQAAPQVTDGFLWLERIGQPDASNSLPLLFALLGAAYLGWVFGKTRLKLALSWGIGLPLLFVLVFRLSAAGNLYLCLSLSLLLVQRAYVTGLLQRLSIQALRAWQLWWLRGMIEGIYPLDHTGALQHSGNKAYRLSVLQQAGLPVPQGLVLRSQAIAAYHQLDQAKRDKLAALLWRMIGRKPCAVRSSAAAEDGAEHSFAGVFESVLDVRGRNMRAALDTVVGSFSALRVAAYEGAQTEHQGNILIQQMVDADYAGVMFTQDPSAPGLMLVELVQGCGDDLVSGRVTPQGLRFGRFSHTGQDSSPIDLTPLLQLGRQIETIFGKPQDIEWAYAQGQFQILQSRDITAHVVGGPEEALRIAEWQKVLGDYQHSDPDAVILEQDEMSELLPNPTPLSFSLMADLWAPGGALDLACRDLRLAYTLPEGRPGHLVRLFGRTYVDRRLKAQMALRLNRSKQRRLHAQARDMLKRFEAETIPALHDDLAVWHAIDFAALPTPKIVLGLQRLHKKLVRGAYVEAEKINILASFTMQEAREFARDKPEAQARLLHPTLRHAPSSRINACAALRKSRRKAALLESMGHRANFDYELSAPRYAEAPEQLWALLDSASPTAPHSLPGTRSGRRDPVSLAIAYQDLKEQAKHEALRIVALMRRAILCLGQRTGLDELIFQLEMSELLELSEARVPMLQAVAQQRQTEAQALQHHALRQVRLSLRDCELLSAPNAARDSAAGPLSGTCVAGSRPAQGPAFVVDDSAPDAEHAFAGFQDGDIIVCRMLNPGWLPWLQRSGGVLSAVGGWLSHMAIVAREKDIPMAVRCSGLEQLQSGMLVQLNTDGSIQVQEAAQDPARLASGRG